MDKLNKSSDINIMHLYNIRPANVDMHDRVSRIKSVFFCIQTAEDNGGSMLATRRLDFVLIYINYS